MSTSIIYHAFGAVNYRYIKTEYHHGCIIFHIRKREKRCADCGGFQVTQKGTRKRIIQTVPIGLTRVFFMVENRRLYCHDCDALRYEALEIADPKKHYDKGLERYIAHLCRKMTVQDVARDLLLSWSTVKEIDKRRLVKEKPANAQLRKIRYLGIDEVAVRKRHRYLTICVDLETGDVVYVGEGRREESLLPFLKRLRRLKVQLLATATDMWPAYLRALQRCFPDTAVIFDRYHLMARYSKLLDALRTQEYRNASKAHKGLFKGVRYLLLKGQEKLTEEKKEKLSLLLNLNQSLSIAYILKEELRRFWGCANEQLAQEHLLNWIRMAKSSGVKTLKKFAKSLQRHFRGLLAYFSHPISTARVEGINNKIKVLKRKAYGYRDMEYFELKIYSANNLRYSLLG